MPQFTQPFTDGLSRAVVVYVSDAGRVYYASTRKGYTEGGIDKLTVGNGTPNLPVRFRMRYLHLMSKNPVGGRRLKRKVPCGQDAIIAYMNEVVVGLGTTFEITNLDGQDWYIMGYTGEYLHKCRG
ncbi:MAG: hypothetical protein C5B59_11495 [Bacteroidetes bacterium]|nr:MAG: hypothetical protein C5B59_11495 [Bacteroidota bacterium]